MSVTGVQIVKSCAFRESVQHFSNRYYYFNAANPTQAQYQGIKDFLVAHEKALHGNHVTFTFYRIWKAGGTKAENEMLEQGTLSGTGSATPASNCDRERAFLVQWPAQLDSRGHRVFLRKWYHLGAPVAGIPLTAAILEQTAGFTTANRAAMEAQFDDINTITVGGVNFNFCGPTGILPTGGVSAYKFLEHHQLGDEWRGA